MPSLKIMAQQISNIDLYKTMKATLFIKDLATGQTKEIPLTANQQGFTGQFIVGNSENYEVMVKAEGNSFFRETPVQQITLKRTLYLQLQKQVRTKNPSLFLGHHAVLIALGAILLVTLIFSYSKNRRKGRSRKGNPGFYGQIVIEIKDEETGEFFETKFEKLKAYKGEFNLQQLFKLSQEFIETEQINFVPLTDYALLIFNKSNCVIEMNGMVIKEDVPTI